MSNPEVALFYARVIRISYDGTLDSLDFLHVIESGTWTAYTEYQRMLIVELSVEGNIELAISVLCHFRVS